jgi:hypothetical protein
MLVPLTLRFPKITDRENPAKFDGARMDSEFKRFSNRIKEKSWHLSALADFQKSLLPLF